MLPVYYRRMDPLLLNLTTAEAEAVLGIFPKLMTGMEQVRADIEKEGSSKI